MRITKIEIKNFRCHEELTLNLQGNHVLVGENGTGKTSILEAINFACSPYFVQSRIVEQDFHNSDKGNIEITVSFDKYFILKVPDGFGHQHIPCQSVKLTVKRRKVASAGKALSEPFVAESVCLPFYYDDLNKIDANLLPEGVPLSKLSPGVKHTVAKIDKEQWGINILRKTSTSKDVRSSLLSITNNELVGYPSIFYFDRSREKETKVGFNSLFSKLGKELNWRYRKAVDHDATASLWQNYYSSVIDTVDKRMNKELLGPALKRAADALGKNTEDIEMSLITLEEPFAKSFLSTRKDLNQVSLGGMGSGVAMIVTYFLLEHFATLAKGGAIFLIDEPEMHLHPQLQQHMAEHFLEASGQTIISTHSPLFVDIGNWHGITRFTQDFKNSPNKEILKVKLGTKTIQQLLDEIPKLKQDVRIFADSDPELFFARRVLLVEGPVDKYGLPRLAKVMNKTFVDTTVISCNGKDKIKFYATLCHAYEISTFVIYDLDGKPADDNGNEQVAQAVNGHKSHTFGTSFETLLGVCSKNNKASKALQKIDNIGTEDDIPPEIRDAITKIEQWSTG